MANEKRLIDANDVSECFRKEKVAILNHVIDPIKTEIAMVILHWCEDKVRDAPTVDAVEVVRCKYCKYYCNGWHCNLYLNVSHETKPDDFCSYGERREGE